MENKNTGRELAEDLARTIEVSGAMVWTNMPLGSVMFSNPGIVDCIAMSKSYTNPNVRIYEVKVSRGDFQRDINRQKFTRYIPFCNRLFFACEKGLIKSSEIPERMWTHHQIRKGLACSESSQVK